MKQFIAFLPGKTSVKHNYLPSIPIHHDHIMIRDRHRSKELTETLRLVPVLPLNSSERTSYEGVEFDPEKGNL